MNWKNKKALVIGAGGFIGSHLTENLVKSGNNVCVIVKSNSKEDVGRINSFDTEIKIIAADLTKQISLKNFMEEYIDVVYHLASITDLENTFQIPDKFYGVNLLGTLNVPEMCRVNEINKIVFDMRK